MKLDELGILWDAYKQECDCNKMVDFPMQKSKDKKINSDILDNAAVSGDLDFLRHSKKSVS